MLKKQYRDTLVRCPVLEVKPIVHSNIRGFNCGYVAIAIATALFVLNLVVGVTMNGGRGMNTKYLPRSPYSFFVTFVRQFLLILSALFMLFATVGAVPPVLLKYLGGLTPHVADVSIRSLYIGVGPCDTC